MEVSNEKREAPRQLKTKEILDIEWKLDHALVKMGCDRKVFKLVVTTEMSLN